MESHRLDLLIINPQLLTFYAPYGRIQRRLLTLLNPTAGKVLFKVRSNASRHYFVSPNCGCIDGYATSEINIRLCHFEFHSNHNYRHRLCIQSSNSPIDDLTQGEEVLSLFKKIPRREIYNVRVPILLNDFNMPYLQTKLSALAMCLKSDRSRERLELRALCPNCVDSLEKAKKQKLRRKILKIVIIMSTIVGGEIWAYLLRHQIYKLFKLDTDDDLEL